jgi:hypothetical protein
MRFLLKKHGRVSSSHLILTPEGYTLYSNFTLRARPAREDCRQHGRARAELPVWPPGDARRSMARRLE